MSEIEKMYENTGIETNKYKLCCTGCKHIAKLEVINGYPSKWICDKYDEVADCDRAEPEYPPFTAEKQIELIKWLAKRPLPLLIGRHKGKYYLGNSYFNSKADSFDNAIATRINDLWQDLTPEEKQQVKGILE